MFVKLSGAVTDITIVGVNNPGAPLPSTSKLHFWAEHWNVNFERVTRVDYLLADETFGAATPMTITLQYTTTN